MNRREGRTLTPEQARHLLETLRGHDNEALYALMLSTDFVEERRSVCGGAILIGQQEF